MRLDRRFAASNNPVARKWWIYTSATSFTYPTPTVLVSDDQITQAQQRISGGSGLYYDAYQLTKRYASYGTLGTDPVTSTPQPYTDSPYQGTNYTQYHQAGFPQSSMARDNALVYRIEGLTGYADKAKSMILAWTNDPALTTNVACDAGGSPSTYCLSAGLVIGRTMLNFASVYALIYDRFTTTERAAIEKWMLGMATRIAYSRMMWQDRISGGGDRFNNHLPAMSMGTLAIGLALDDSQLVFEAIRSGTNPKDARVLMNGALLPACGTTGQPACSAVLNGNDPTLTSAKPKPVQGEIFDRYRSLQVGPDVCPAVSASDGCRGLMYAGLQLRFFALVAEMAKNSHYDQTLFVRTTPNGVQFQDSFTAYAPFWSYNAHTCPGLGIDSIGPTALFQQGTGYYSNDSPGLLPVCWRGNSPTWEFAYREYGDAASRAVLCHNRGRLTYEPEAIGWNGPLLFGVDVTC